MKSFKIQFSAMQASQLLHVPEMQLQGLSLSFLWDDSCGVSTYAQTSAFVSNLHET